MNSPESRPRIGVKYYQPREILDVPGVKRVSIDGCRDRYNGTKDALIAAGLAVDGMFPGQPGMGKVFTSFRPLGVPKEWNWFSTPGYLTITLHRDACTFLVDLTVSVAERERRRQAEELAARQRELEHQRCADANAFRDVPVEANIRFENQKSRGHLRLVWSHSWQRRAGATDGATT